MSLINTWLIVCYVLCSLGFIIIGKCCILSEIRITVLSVVLVENDNLGTGSSLESDNVLGILQTKRVQMRAGISLSILSGNVGSNDAIVVNNRKVETTLAS